MKSAIVMANYKNTYSHNFNEGEYIMKVTSHNAVANYMVDEVVSNLKIKIRLIHADGSLSSASETISGKELDLYFTNKIANDILKERNLINNGK